MPNQITMPQGNTQTLHLTPMPVLFKAGDSVLCPSLGNGFYTLAQHRDKVNFKHKVYFVDGQDEPQIFRPDGTEYKGELPAIFHDTPANRQAIATLYGIEYEPNPKHASNSQLTLDRYEITDIHSNLQSISTGVYQAINALSLAKHATHASQINSLVNIAIDSLLANHGVLEHETERLTHQINGGIQL